MNYPVSAGINEACMNKNLNDSKNKFITNAANTAASALGAAAAGFIGGWEIINYYCDLALQDMSAAEKIATPAMVYIAVSLFVFDAIRNFEDAGASFQEYKKIKRNR